MGRPPPETDEIEEVRKRGFRGQWLKSVIERIDGLESPEEADRELARGRAYLERAVAEAVG